MAEMIKAIKLTPHDQGKCTSKDSSSDDTTKDTSQVEYDPNLDLQLRDILSKVFSYRGSIILGFPCLSDEQVKKNADHIGKVLSGHTTADTSQEDIKLQLVDVQIKKSKYEQVKDAKDRFNAKAGPDDPKLSIIRIFTEELGNIIAVRGKAIDDMHPVYFKPKDRLGDVTEHDDDTSTYFVNFDYVTHDKGELTKFVNCCTWLPMGTTEYFEIHGTNSLRLYTYGDPDVPLATEMDYDQILSELAQKFKKSNQLQNDLFYFKIHGPSRDLPAVIYPSYMPDHEFCRISKDLETESYEKEPNAVISKSLLKLIITVE